MQLVTTGDGSHTLYLPRLDEHYHSTYGAIQESMHVFIQAGLFCLLERPMISVLEIGFGTGLNALLACMTAREYRKEITYHTLEKFPVDARITGKLNYPALLSAAMDPAGLFAGIHSAPWNTTVIIHPCFQIHKIMDDLLTFQPDFQYDLIFFDAFAPGKQPEMWSPEIFTRLHKNLNPEGIITTYCAKGEVQRMLKAAGFRIEKLPGPPGKREILRGRK
jgi:tRNA U34 5-methylaminomethyl-2-thiouridine-forming methyltransferase MnmC